MVAKGMEMFEFGKWSRARKMYLFFFLTGLTLGGFLGLFAAIGIVVLVLVLLFLLPVAIKMGAQADPASKKPKEPKEEE